jgi:hypothetical protein
MSKQLNRRNTRLVEDLFTEARSYNQQALEIARKEDPEARGEILALEHFIDPELLRSARGDVKVDDIGLEAYTIGYEGEKWTVLLRTPDNWVVYTDDIYGYKELYRGSNQNRAVTAWIQEAHDVWLNKKEEATTMSTTATPATVAAMHKALDAALKVLELKDIDLTQGVVDVKVDLFTAMPDDGSSNAIAKIELCSMADGSWSIENVTYEVYQHTADGATSPFTSEDVPFNQVGL